MGVIDLQRPSPRNYSPKFCLGTLAGRNVASLTIVGATALLFGLIFGLIFPTTWPSSTFAESSAATSSDSTISITVPSAITLDLTPALDSASFDTAAAEISVTTDNAYGYSLYMGTSGTDGDEATATSLIHQTNSSNTIPSITSATTEDDFPVNSWGYTTDNNGSNTHLGQITAGYYQPFATTDSGSTLIKRTNATASADTTTVTFAAKADITLPSGDYGNTITFSVTANLKPVTIFDIGTMQAITSSICSDTTTPSSSATSLDTDGSHAGDINYIPQTVLTDTRDNKTYAIRKLADGNCWMVQNLALSTGTALSSDDTDIESTSTYTLPTADTANFTLGSNPKYSGDNNNEMYTGTHVDGYVSTSQTDLTDTGNWYSWYAATAGTGTAELTSGSATSSICPKGWKLPAGTESGQFYALYTTYGSDKTSFITAFPIQVSGGYHYDGLVNSGKWGAWWSSTAFSAAGAYNLSVNASYSTINNPGTRDDGDSNGYKYRGDSVRCVAQ